MELKWINFQKSLENIENIKINRWYHIDKKSKIQRKNENKILICSEPELKLKNKNQNNRREQKSPEESRECVFLEYAAAVENSQGLIRSTQ